MSRHLKPAIAIAIAMTMLTAGLATAHPDHSDPMSGAVELFPGEGVVLDKQHDGIDGHLDPRRDNVRVIGHGVVSAPPGTNGDMTGRVADVAAHGNFAYLTAFRAADCLGGGAWVVDMTNPRVPRETAFMPTTDGVYAGEGAQVIVPEHGEYAGVPLFIHQNESCNLQLAFDTGKERYRGGINIWDVSDPRAPQLLVEHAGDTDGPVAPQANDVHSMFAWNSHVDERVYAVLVDNYEFTDVDIMDITDPTNPVMVNDTLDLFDLFGIGADNPPNLGSIFNHDMMVYRHGDRYVMNVNYWDGGYVLLDVTDPTPGNVSLITNWSFPEFDDQRLLRGEEISPEGNAHQSEISPDFRYMIGTDEDFSPYRFSFTSSAFEGERTAIEADFTPPIATVEGGLAGDVVHVGRGCPASPGIAEDPYLGDPAGSIALVERGVCNFTHKVARAQLAGATGVIVYGVDDTLVLMGGDNPIPDNEAGGDVAGVEITIPAVYVQRSTGLLLRDGEPPVSALATAVFDGWGYVRLFGLDVDEEVGSTGSMEQIDTYAIPESQDPDFAVGFGDLSVHEVAMDPRPGVNLAYLSYYAGGLRVVQYGDDGLHEVGAFIDRGGNNFWGVEVHQHPNGQQYVLLSDRDSGLYIVQFDDGTLRGPNAPARPRPGQGGPWGPGGPPRP